MCRVYKGRGQRSPGCLPGMRKKVPAQPREILDAAAAADPPRLRSLDAIHLATALSVDDPRMEVITYDRGFAEAPRANGLIVVQPGLR
jgi:predicted nucleic acid-binding protein